VKTTVEILREARKRLEQPEAWTRGDFGRTEHGNSVSPIPSMLREASCLCVNGALIASDDDNGSLMHSRASAIMSQCARRRGFETVSKLNDAPETTHADILALFDEAIAWAESDS
jgi:hypothetical protein